ncbi:helix-turn-helix transcriptional regulator [Enterobacter oligotrophicus]|uniref:helix-turn-helix domain-containing protein n=1 Tax=Enterobacter TaxID=547 RepID=UPI001C036087|nr:XRE family transcriptional regulator [Enterobacter oligotrophicus]ELW1647614.1 helix-turn-helix transcriptional regulator [Enterobacter oligotrophicus]MBT9424004.1 helix-turn-helix transcriptional regulator [Enterobacter oligotrophicus]
MDITQHLASTLKSLRQARGWSLSKLAEETGVSKAMLGQIERNESSPTVSTLWKIATGLNVPFSAFITPETDPQAVFDPQQQAMVVKPLFPWDDALKFDHFSITLAPGAFSESTPHEAGVIEHVVVISGELEMNIEGSWRTLYADSGVRFAGDKPHAYRNSGTRTVHFHSLIHYPR